MRSRIIERDIQEIILEFEENLKSLSGKTILITGGNGFIASYLVDVFVEFNKKLQTPCRLIIINKNEINENSRLSHLINNENVEFIAQDIGKSFEIPANVNIIIHAASTATPATFLQNPLVTVDSNVFGIRNLLEYTIKNPVKNFLFFSSADIYGSPDRNFIPTPETYSGNVDCLNPRACYSESKRISETLCSIFFQVYKTPTKILRIGHTYGPGLRNDKAIHEFFHKSKTFQKIDLKDRGEAEISFCYISDVIRGILKVMFSGNSGEAYNIGNGYPAISIKELASEIANIQNNNTIVNPNYEKENDNSREYIRYLKINKLRNLNFEPKVSLIEGLRKLKEHIDEVGLN